MLEKMFDDTLWIYTAIAGSLFGAAFLAYFKGTKAGLWCYAKLDFTLVYLVERWGLTWFEQPIDAWRKKYPHVTHKIDELEARIIELEKSKAHGNAEKSYQDAF
tara:strand:+ start:248 stop:559 length:312 start_codon:yes stop_codon:yes gene_type:complete